MQISDDIFLGTAIANGQGMPESASGPSRMPQGVGPMGRVFLWDFVPLTLQAAGLATSQNPGSGASFTLAAGTGVTVETLADGTLAYVLDVPRCVTITAAGANTATYRVEGYDQYGQFMTANVAAPSTSTVATTKAFKKVTRIVNINATAGTNGLTAGFNNTFGFPVRVTDPAYLVSVKWDATLADNAATVVAAVTTDPATASTGDVRGTIAFGGNAANGARRGVVAIAIPAIGSGPNATRVGAFGVTQA